MSEGAPCPRCGDVRCSAGERDALGGACPRCVALEIRRDLEEPPPPPPVPPEAAEGPRVGKYRLAAKLGSGGMGEVWKAWDTVLGRWVALKFLKDDGEVPRFLREARTAAGLTHPNIATVYETGLEDGRHFIAMRFIDGVTLEEFPRTDRRLLVELLRDVARAIAYAHGEGVVHRDLKPGNLMVTDGPSRVVVMDFGLARRVEGGQTLSRSETILGTPAYMSPEQARGETADARSDVYSLGATLYQLMTDRPPLEGRNVYELLDRVQKEDPSPPRRWNPAVEPEVEIIVLKCLEKEPRRRYAGAGALAEDLTRYLEGKPIEARPASAAYRLRKLISRRKAVWSIGAAAVVALAAVVSILMPLALRERSRALEQLRKRTDIALAAVLEVRRAGGTAERMKGFILETETACDEAIALLPELAEPHHRLGRTYRAAMRFDEALGQQERALAKEPAHPGARYERGLLRVRRYEERLQALRDQWRRRQAERTQGSRNLAARKEPPRGVLEEEDEKDAGRGDHPAAKALKALALADLAGLEPAVARGLAAWLEGRIEAAESLLETATRESPDVEEAWEWWGRIADERCDHVEAARRFSEGTSRDRGYLPHMKARSAAWFSEVGHRVRDGKDVEEAYAYSVAALGDLLQMDPTQDAVWGDRGGIGGEWITYRSSRGVDASEIYRRAVADLTEAIRLQPGEVNHWTRRGAAYSNYGTHLEELGQDPSELFRLGAADLDEALRLAPSIASTWKNRGTLRSNWAVYRSARGEDTDDMTRQCVADLTEAIRLEPGDAHSWLFRAKFHVNLGRARILRWEDPGSSFEEAIRDLDEALRLQTSLHEGWTTRGNVHGLWGVFLMQSGKDPSELFEKAIVDYDRAVKEAPTLPDAWASKGQVRYNFAMFQLTTGRDPSELCRSSIADLDEALRINPLRADYWKSRGTTKSIWGVYRSDHDQDPSEQYRGGIADLSEALRRNSSDASAWTARGGIRVNWANHKSGQGENPLGLYAEAVADFEKAVSLNPKDSTSWSYRGNAQLSRASWRQRQGETPRDDWKGALESYESAVRITPQVEPKLRPIMESARKLLAESPVRRKAQPDRLSLGTVFAGALVEADVRVFMELADVQGAKVEVSAPPFLKIVRREVSPDGRAPGQNAGCDVYLVVDTSRPGRYEGMLGIRAEDQSGELPVSIVVLEKTPDRPRVLFSTTPFQRFSTGDASLLDPLVEAVRASGVDAHYAWGLPEDVSAFDVLLLGERTLCSLNEGQRERLRAFVEAGGRLIFCPNAFMMGSVPAANSFVRGFGLTIEDHDGKPAVCRVFTEDELTRDLGSLSFHRASPVRVTDPARAALLVPDPTDPGSGFLAVSRGKGEVVVLTQSLWWHWLYQGKEHDNARLFGNLITWRKRAK